MISETIGALIDELKEFWDGCLKASPVYALDGTWPSLGIVDLMTDSMRLREELSSFEEKTLRGCAAYIGSIVHDCWESFGAVPILELVPEGGIVIRATRGPGIAAGEEVTVALEAELRKALIQLPNPFPVLNGFSRFLSVSENIISPFTIGIATGLSPAIRGPWSENVPESFTGEAAKVVRLLATRCAESYAFLYPDEPLGQVSELYLHDVVYPPMLMMEDWPARRAVRGLWKFFSEYKVTPRKMAEVSYNLAFSPDELLSHAGFAFHAALLDEEPTAAFRALAASKGTFAALLRPAMIDVRNYCGLGPDWLSAQDELPPESVKRIDLELKLNFHPWVQMPAEKIATIVTDEELRALLHATASFEAKKALNIAKKIAEDTPHDIALRLQHVYLEVINDDLSAGTEAVRAVLSEPEAASNAEVANIAGLLYLITEDFAAAAKHFERAAEIGDGDVLADARNSYGWLKFCAGESNEALKLFNQALDDAPGLLVALLNKTGLLFRMGYDGAAWLCMEMMVSLAPCDRRVFAGLVLNVFQGSNAAAEDGSRSELRRLA